MPVDKKFFARSIQKKEQLFAAYCAATNMPLIVCDDETFNDQVWLFDTEEQFRDFAKTYTEQKMTLKGVKLKNKDFLHFFAMLFTLGVNELVFVNSSGVQSLGLEELVKHPDYSKLPKEQQPITNPELQLTGLYFMQEASRAVPNEEKPKLKELNEELSVNIMKARYMMPIDLADGPESETEKLKEKKFRLPLLKNKNGDILQPVFTDTNEFAKFNKDNKLRALVIPFNNLSKLLIKDSRGYLLNPMGFHLMMPKELLDSLDQQYEV